MNYFLRPRATVGCPAAGDLWSPGAGGWVIRRRERLPGRLDPLLLLLLLLWLAGAADPLFFAGTLCLASCRMIFFYHVFFCVK